MFPELGMALPVSRIAVNIPLIDFTLENECTEFGPGRVTDEKTYTVTVADVFKLETTAIVCSAMG